MRHLLLAALVASAHAQVAVTTAADWPEAVAKAKAEGKDIAVLLDGSDWSPLARTFRTEVAGSTAVRTATAKTHVWVTIDSPERETEATKALAERNKPFGFRPWNIPAVALADTEGRVYASVAAMDARDSATPLGRLSPAIIAHERMQSRLVAAKDQQGERRAAAIGAALAEIDLGLARSQFRGLVQELAQLDPKDATGWRLRYEFDDIGFLEGTVLRLCDQKQADEAVRECDKRLANPRISTEQRQQILAARFAALRRGGKPSEALGTLGQIAAIDGSTDLGKNARHLAAFHSQPVKLRGWFWEGWDMRPEPTPMEIDASAKVAGPGNYAVETKGWGLHIRSVALVAGEKVLAETTRQQGGAWKLSLAERPSGPIRLRLLANGQGWFDGRGTIELKKE